MCPEVILLLTWLEGFYQCFVATVLVMSAWTVDNFSKVSSFIHSFIHSFVCLFIHLSIQPSIHLIHLFIHLFICLFSNLW